jgi:hypothetical protein
VIDVERRLLDAGAAWRAGQPEPAEPDWHSLAVRPSRRRWPALATVAAAVAVLIVLGGTALYLGAFREKATPAPPVASTNPTATPSATPSATLPPAPPAPRLSLADSVVRDGDTVAGSGYVWVEPRQPVRFCATVMIQKRHYCVAGVPLTRVDLGPLVDVQRAENIRYGRTWLRGVFRGGAIAVTAQARPAPLDPGRMDPVKLCKPPRGGWDTNVDPTPLTTYVDAHPERFNGIMVTSAGTGMDVHIVGVPRGSLSAALRDLRAEFGPNVCVVRVRYDAVTQRRARAALGRLMQSGGTGIVMIGGGNGFNPVRVEIWVLSQRVYDRLRAIGLDQLDVRVLLTPVR